MSKTCFDSGFLRCLDVESKEAIGRSLAVPLVKDRALATTLTSSHLLPYWTSKIRNNNTARIETRDVDTQYEPRRCRVCCREIATFDGKLQVA